MLVVSDFMGSLSRGLGVRCKERTSFEAIKLWVRLLKDDPPLKFVKSKMAPQLLKS